MACVLFKLLRGFVLTLARETAAFRSEGCVPRRALARADGRRRGRSPDFAAGSIPGSSMGIVESYSGACGGARSCLAIDQARMWLLGKSCVSCLAGGQRTRFLAGILFGNIFRSLEQHCGVRAAPRSRFLANLVESAKHSCRAPLAASVNGSRQPGAVQRKPKENRNVRVCIAA